ncbi:MAG: arginine--tRNA ligase [Candidatus Margulisiibacteriota bacterium]
MKKELEKIVTSAVNMLYPAIGGIYSISVTGMIGIPNKKYGDFSSNAALLLAPKLLKPLPDIAEEIAQYISSKDKNNLFKSVEFTKTGFINFKLNDRFLQDLVSRIKKENSGYGRSDIEKGKKALIEFVSANPTGPLHIGHGRWAVIGDDIASLLEAVGYKVEREFYVNDQGNQIDKLEASVKARAEGKEVPEGGYGGAYVLDLAEKLKNDIDKPNFRGLIIKMMLDDQKRVLRELGVQFDRFFSERSLHENGKVKEAIEKLKKTGGTFMEDGALWFKSTDHGDDKNRVIVRENGESTYFAADIAYHLDKFDRGYDLLINVWGADHHGYVARLKTALNALGLPIERFEIIIGQLVSLYRGSEPVRMSKRTGDMITLEEVIKEIGKDSTRFFLTMVTASSHLDFDLELAKKQAADNPVFYVQYAHARICSIFRELEAQGQKLDPNPDLSLLSHPAERELLRRLLDFEDEIITAARKREPHLLVEYAKSVAAIYHNYYHKCRVISEDHNLTQARLALAEAARIVIKNVLELLKVEAPERM